MSKTTLSIDLDDDDGKLISFRETLSSGRELDISNKRGVYITVSATKNIDDYSVGRIGKDNEDKLFVKHFSSGEIDRAMGKAMKKRAKRRLLRSSKKAVA